MEDARRYLEIYELADDQIGQALADLVLERHAAGVHVKILYDSLGSLGSSATAYFERLRTGGDLAQEFHPVNPTQDLRIWRITARDHRKFLIVDGKVAFTGGINFSRVYARGSSAGTAEVGQQMEDLFQQDLRLARLITLRQWQARSLREWFMETLSCLFRYWF